MELKQFITATLVDINQGVYDAIMELKESQLGAAINPIYSKDGQLNNGHIPKHLQQVEFDIAITTENDTTTESKGAVKGGIKVLSGSYDNSTLDKESDTKYSRIKFSVPIIPPATSVNLESIDLPKIGRR